MASLHTYDEYNISIDKFYLLTNKNKITNSDPETQLQWMFADKAGEEVLKMTLKEIQNKTLDSLKILAKSDQFHEIYHEKLYDSNAIYNLQNLLLNDNCTWETLVNFVNKNDNVQLHDTISEFNLSNLKNYIVPMIPII